MFVTTEVKLQITVQARSYELKLALRLGLRLDSGAASQSPKGIPLRSRLCLDVEASARSYLRMTMCMLSRVHNMTR